MSDQPSLAALRAFVAVGEAGSIRGAAQAMGVDHAAVSRHLRRVEQALGVALVEQRGRRQELTEAGARYHARLRAAFNDIRTATEEVAGNRRPVFEIHAQPGIAHRLLLPALPALSARLSEVDVMIHTANEQLETEPENCFVEIYFGVEPRHASGYRDHVLAAPRFFPVANPGADPRWFAVESAEDLMAFPIINAQNAAGLWEIWLGELGSRAEIPRSGLQMPNTHLALEAARFGQGIALANEMLVRADFASGDLREILRTDTRIEGYRLAVPDRWAGSAPVRALHGWLNETLGTPARQAGEKRGDMPAAP
ncbi:LysR family transcriptional regulator [Salipiger mucosus]|uniref:HTH lysR-type domain-containing protein n=1 Tax=Salipiger mucosus DSM 16094 TaxID=1123237 RepID=S9QKM8_9RHOB|nr:LysR family transcriptional regulator [Salipiger mucosus]EPX80352.1 hypothetical protein Salmuc_03668 [Salipiger mucosus DSM 16094]